MDATPVATDASQQVVLRAVRNVIVLSDGRVGALVDIGGPAGGRTTTFAVFARAGNQWLIDDGTVVEAGGGTPAAGTPVG